MGSAQGAVTAVSRNEVYSFTKPVRDEIVLVAGIGVEGDVHAGVHVRHRSRVRADPGQPNLRQVHLIHEELFAEVAGKGYEVRPGNLGENVTTSGIDLLGLPTGTILRFGPAPAAGDGAGDGSAGAGEAGGAGSGGLEGAGGAAGVGSVSAGGAAAGVGADRAGRPRSDGSGDVGAVAGVLAAAEASTLDAATEVAAAAVAGAAARDAAERGDDPRPAVVVAGLRNPCAQINGFRAGLLNEVVGRDENGEVERKGGVMAVVLRGGAVRAGDPISVELPPLPHVPLDRV